MGYTSILLTKGSLNNLVSLTTILSGAASFDMEVRVFVMDDAVWAFRKDKYLDLKVDSSIDGYAEALKAGVVSGTINSWHKLLTDLKEFGEISITLCGLMADIDNLEKEAFLDVVDRIATIGTFIDDVFDADKIISI